MNLNTYETPVAGFRQYRPYFDMEGTLHTSMRIKCRIAFARMYFQTAVNGGSILTGSFSKDGTSFESAAPNSFAINPMRMPSYVTISAGTSYETGITLADSGLMSVLALCFQRYRVRHFGLSYNTTAPNNQAGGAILAFSTDPCNLNFGLNASGPDPQVGYLNESPQAFEVPAWLNWDCSFHVDDSQLYYVWAPTLYQDGLADTPFNTAGLRQSCIGALSCLTSSTVGSALSVGELFQEWDIEFCDPMVLPGGFTTLAPFKSSLIQPDLPDLLTFGKKTESKSPIKEDEDGDEVVLRIVEPKGGTPGASSSSSSSAPASARTPSVSGTVTGLKQR